MVILGAYTELCGVMPDLLLQRGMEGGGMEGRFGGDQVGGMEGRLGDQVKGRYGGDKDIPFGQQCN